MIKEALIAKIEKATIGSRELDGEIFRAVKSDIIEADWENFNGVWHQCDPEDAVAWIPPLFYTTKIDDALTLVPEGWFVPSMGERRTPIKFWGDVHEPICHFAQIQWINGGGRLQHGDAATIALAITIAALKARLLQSRLSQN